MASPPNPPVQLHYIHPPASVSTELTESHTWYSFTPPKPKLPAAQVGEYYAAVLRPPSFDETYADRLLGCLLGGAVGDAFGYAVEFDSLTDIRSKHGPDGLTEPVEHQDRILVSR